MNPFRRPKAPPSPSGPARNPFRGNMSVIEPLVGATSRLVEMRDALKQAVDASGAGDLAAVERALLTTMQKCTEAALNLDAAFKAVRAISAAEEQQA